MDAIMRILLGLKMTFTLAQRSEDAYQAKGGKDRESHFHHRYEPGVVVPGNGNIADNQNR
jgi:hypothetical protein